MQAETSNVINKTKASCLSEFASERDLGLRIDAVNITPIRSLVEDGDFKEFYPLIYRSPLCSNNLGKLNTSQEYRSTDVHLSLEKEK